jgi:type I restriction enzyme S subunit
MNTSTIRFKAIEGVSDLRFLWVWLNSSEFRGQITRLVTGSAQQNFGPSHLSLLKVTLPPLSTQHEFARRVLAIDELRRVQHASSTELDSLFASLQHRAFRGEL